MDDSFIDEMGNMDLFIEEPQILQMNQPAVQGLPTRVEELCISGACQKLAWSKYGIVASVTPDNLGVHIQALIRDPETKAYRLMEPTSLTLPTGQKFSNIAHIMWNPSGSELTVVDINGRLSIYQTLYALNRVLSVTTQVFEQVDILGGIVGMEWLAATRHTGSYQATRTGGSWQYPSSFTKISGVVHPMHRGGLFTVTRYGALRLSFADLDGSWNQISSELAAVDSGNNILTHAAFSYEPDRSLMLVTADFSHTFRVYRINLSWNFPMDVKVVVPPGSHLVPTVNLTRIHVMTPQRPPAITLSHARICHLLMMPSAVEVGAGTTIIAFYTGTIGEATAGGPDNRPRASHIARWELQEVQKGLHPIFNQLKLNKEGPTNIEPEIIVRALAHHGEDLMNTIVAVQLIRYNTTLAIARSDGSVEFRDRAMQPIQNETQSETLSSLMQLGYGFPASLSGLHFSISPNACTMVVASHEGELELRYMELLGQGNHMMDTSEHDLAAAVLPAAFATSIAQAQTADDILAFSHTRLPPGRVQEVLEGLYAVFQISIHLPDDHDVDRVIKNGVVPKCLGIQQSLLTRSSAKSSTVMIPWIIMNLRQAIVVFRMAIMNPSAPDAGITELPTTLLGLVKWILDLMTYISASTTHSAIMTSTAQLEADGARSEQPTITPPASLATLLLLSSIPRNLLRESTRAIRNLSIRATQFSHPARNRDWRGWRALIALISSATIDPVSFDALLNDIDKAVRTAYDTAALADDALSRAEREMQWSGSVPEVLQPVLAHLTPSSPAFEKFMSEVRSLSALWSADVSWLGVSEGDAQRSKRQRVMRYDAVRKVPLVPTKGAGIGAGWGVVGTGGAGGTMRKVRRCVRCGAFMEDIHPKERHPGWLLTMHKECVCSGVWVLVDV